MFYYFFIIYLIFGIFFRTLLNWEYIDEISIVCFLIAALFRTNIFNNREFKILCIYILFSLMYSFAFSVNRNIYAICLDAFQQFKPFLMFYAVYMLWHKPLTAFQNRNLAKLSFLLATISFLIILISGDIHAFYGHPGNYSCSILCFAMIHYFFTKGKNTKATFLIMLFGIIGGRSKMFGEVVLVGYILFALKKKFKFNFKYLLVFFFLLVGIIFVAREKISIYLYGDDVSTADQMARTLFYTNMPYLLLHYFPFGSGLASYATWFSGVYYSPLYAELGMSNVYGITWDFYDFVADTYFPSLAEFGALGIFLFLLFWVKRYKVFRQVNYHYKMKLIILGALAIESIASPFIVSAVGVIPIIVLAINEKECLTFPYE